MKIGMFLQLTLPKFSIFSFIMRLIRLRRWVVKCLSVHPCLPPFQPFSTELARAREAVQLLQSAGFEPVFIQQQPKSTFIKRLGDQLKDGDYIKDEYIKADQKGGILIDDSTTEQQQQFKGEECDRLLANSLLRVKKTTHKYYFSRMELMQVCQRYKHSNAQNLYINAPLTSLQIYNIRIALLKSIFNLDIGVNRSSPQDASQTEPQEELQIDQGVVRKVRVYDRTSLILLIFHKRIYNQQSQLLFKLGTIKQAKMQLSKSRRKDLLELSVFKDLEIQNLNGLLKEYAKKESQIHKRLKQIRNKNKQVALAQSAVSKIGFVGYTNVGKSALINALLKKEQLSSKNRLFQTLEVKSKKFKLSNGYSVVLLDSVGFVEDIPQSLVQLFRNILSVLKQADLLIHVIDSSSQAADKQRITVKNWLQDLGMLDESKYLQIWNKSDCALQANRNRGVQTSATLKTGVFELSQLITSKTLQVKGFKQFKLTIQDKYLEDLKKWVKVKGNGFIAKVEQQWRGKKGDKIRLWVWLQPHVYQTLMGIDMEDLIKFD